MNSAPEKERDGRMSSGMHIVSEHRCALENTVPDVTPKWWTAFFESPFYPLAQLALLTQWNFSFSRIYFRKILTTTTFLNLTHRGFLWLKNSAFTFSTAFITKSAITQVTPVDLMNHFSLRYVRTLPSQKRFVECAIRFVKNIFSSVWKKCRHVCVCAKMLYLYKIGDKRV